MNKEQWQQTIIICIVSIITIAIGFVIVDTSQIAVAEECLREQSINLTQILKECNITSLGLGVV